MLETFFDPEEGLYGYKNEYGEIIIPASFEKAAGFDHGLAIVSDSGKDGLINEQGNFILPVEFDSLFISSTGWVHARKKGEHYLFTTGGQLQLQVNDILTWYFPVERFIRAKKKSGWGFMDINGETIIPFIHKSLGPMINDRVALYENGQWGWMNMQGDVIAAACFDEVGWWNEWYWWGRQKGQYALYDLSGEIVRKEGWTKIAVPVNNVAIVKSDNGWKYINNDFVTLLQLPPVYDGVEYFRNGLAAVKRNDRWGFIDPDGEEVIAPLYEKVDSFSEGLAAVQQNGLWGFINEAGEEVIPCKYHSVRSFRNGKALVHDGWYSSWYINRFDETVGVVKYSEGE